LLQPASDDLFDDAAALILRPHSQRTHPAFGAGAMHHVEGDDMPAVVTPEHGTGGCVLHGVAPNRRIEERHSYAYQSVPPIPFGERVAEDLIQLPDVVEAS